VNSAWLTIQAAGTDKLADVQIDDAYYFPSLPKSHDEDACSPNAGNEGPSDTARTTIAMPNPRTTIVHALPQRMNVE
jgi:hypothetical protein